MGRRPGAPLGVAHVTRPIPAVDTGTRSQGVTTMPEIRCAVEVLRGVPVVTAPEEIDILNSTALLSALLAAAELRNGSRTFVVDMSRTRFCDASGVRTLLAACKQVQADGGQMLVAVTTAAVLRVFELTGIDGMLPSFASLDEALAQSIITTDGSKPSAR
jgi:anti-sigma B factor antagonist